MTLKKMKILNPSVTWTIMIFGGLNSGKIISDKILSLLASHVA